jgi:hypothetical protein
MISISHWGEFPTDAIDHLAPCGYKFADHPASEWKRPDGMITCEPYSVGPNYRLMTQTWLLDVKAKLAKRKAA